MQQLTKSQIIELRAEALYLNEWKNAENNTLFSKLEVDDKSYWIESAQATIDADEKAGVLMLVEEGADFEFGDFLKHKLDNDGETYTSDPDTMHYCQERQGDMKIIQRANTPVYQTKKEPNQ